MEEISHRAIVFSFDSITGNQREYFARRDLLVEYHRFALYRVSASQYFLRAQNCSSSSTRAVDAPLFTAVSKAFALGRICSA